MNRFGEMPKWEGNLAANDKLTKGKHISSANLYGAETIVFNRNGEMISGLLNGQIAKISLNGDIEKIVHMGDESDEKICSNKFKMN
jgi:hypothetical protein